MDQTRWSCEGQARSVNFPTSLPCCRRRQYYPKAWDDYNMAKELNSSVAYFLSGCLTRDLKVVIVLWPEKKCQQHLISLDKDSIRNLCRRRNNRECRSKWVPATIVYMRKMSKKRKELPDSHKAGAATGNKTLKKWQPLLSVFVLDNFLTGETQHLTPTAVMGKGLL